MYAWSKGALVNCKYKLENHRSCALYAPNIIILLYMFVYISWQNAHCKQISISNQRLVKTSKIALN